MKKSIEQYDTEAHKIIAAQFAAAGDCPRDPYDIEWRYRFDEAVDDKRERLIVENGDAGPFDFDPTNPAKYFRENPQ